MSLYGSSVGSVDMGITNQSANASIISAMTDMDIRAILEMYLKAASALSASLTPNAAEHTGTNAAPAAWDITITRLTKLHGTLYMADDITPSFGIMMIRWTTDRKQMKNTSTILGSPTASTSRNWSHLILKPLKDILRYILPERNQYSPRTVDANADTEVAIPAPVSPSPAP